MNTFKKGDVTNRGTVSYTQGPYVYFQGGAIAEHDFVTLVPQPKFKPGDVVRNSHQTYTIKCMKTHYGNSSNPYTGGSIAYDYTDGGWDREESITLVRSGETTLGDILAKALAKKQPAIVARKHGLEYKPSTFPVIHATVELAKKEAERLAVKHPGVEFGTFVLAHRSTATAPSVSTAAA